MNDDIFSGLFYLIEFLNPPTLLEMNTTEIAGMMNLCVMLISGFAFFIFLRDLGAPEATRRTISVCFALMIGIFMSEGILILMAILYAGLARMLDGFFFGVAVGEIYRGLRGKLYSLSPLYVIGGYVGFFVSVRGFTP